MELESSLPYSKALYTCPYPEPSPSSPTTPFHFLKIHLSIILPPTLCSPQWSHSLWFPHQHLLHTSHFIHATCPAHLILDFITPTILDEEYRSLSSTLCNFLHSPVNPSLFGPKKCGHEAGSYSLWFELFCSFVKVFGSWNQGQVMTERKLCP